MEPCREVSRSNNSTLKDKTMYYIFMTIASVVFVMIGATNVDGGYLWIAMLVIGGIYLGHVMTEALNEK
jgi:hypothetical protein